MSVSQPSRGDVWSVKFDPTLGRDQAGTRPAVVISVDKFDHGPTELVIVLPITSKDKRQPIHVSVTPPEGGLSLEGGFFSTFEQRTHQIHLEGGDASSDSYCFP